MIEEIETGSQISRTVPFKIGERVEHYTYGVGTVVSWKYKADFDGRNEYEQLIITINADEGNRWRQCFPEHLISITE